MIGTEPNTLQTAATIFEAITQIITLLGAFWLLLKAVKLLPHEHREAEMNEKAKETAVAMSIEELTEKYAQRLIVFQEKIDALEGEVRELRKLPAQIERMQCELDNYKIENDVLREWAKALIDQLEGVKVTPARMPPIQRKLC